MDEILQHFARVFPMPGRIDGREDYLALAKTWSDQLEPYTDEQVKEACRRLMGKLKRFPYPSDVRDELAPASATSTTVVSLSVEVDTSSIDAAQVKVRRLHGELASAKADLLAIGAFKDRFQIVDTLRQLVKQNEAAVEMLSQLLKELESFHAKSKLQFSGPRFE